MPTARQSVCFVITSFSSRQNRVWEEAILPAVKSAGFVCERGDTSDVLSDSIMQFVVQRIFAADAIVADLTTASANVFYELGIAHTIAAKTVVLLAEGTRELPFDVAAYRAIKYKKNDLGSLRARLEQTLSALRVASGVPPANPVRQFGPASFRVPYRKDPAGEAVREILGGVDSVVAVASGGVVGGRGFSRDSDNTVLQLASQHLGTVTRTDAATIDLSSSPSDVLIVGSPRFNRLADRVQQLYDLPCQYVSARARGDAGVRDASPVLTPLHRTLRIVTTHGDELAASIDNGIGKDSDGTDYGLIVLATLPNGRRLFWFSGIHGKGTLGAFQCFVRHADRLLPVLDACRAPSTAITQLVRVKYAAGSDELSVRGIDGEMLGDPVISKAAARRSEKRAVVLDLGDVVMKFDRDRTYRSIAHLLRADYRAVRALIEAEDAHTQLVRRYEDGRLSSEAFCEALVELFGGDARLREWIAEFWGDIFWPNYEMFEVIRLLKRQHIVLGLLSNTNPLHLQQIEKDYPEIMSLFDVRSLSFEVGSAKPQPAIFHDMIGKLRQLNVALDNALYVDDLERHVAAMRRSGIDGFVYQSHSHFVLWLRKKGIDVPTIIEREDESVAAS
jgi:FMN phosphatase YigB (HAD superfamily)